MVRQGVLGKAAPPVSHAVAFAAYAALHTALAKAPWRKATVKATAWGLRVARTTERKTRETAERARLTVADVLAEAVELAKSFGTEDSGRFVNGVLGRIVRALESGTAHQDAEGSPQPDR